MLKVIGLLFAKAKRKSVILGEETVKQHLPRAELRDGTRPRVLAFKNLAVLAAVPRLTVEGSLRMVCG